MIEYKSGERLGYIKKSPHSPECVSSIFSIESEKKKMIENEITFSVLLEVFKASESSQKK